MNKHYLNYESPSVEIFVAKAMSNVLAASDGTQQYQDGEVYN